MLTAAERLRTGERLELRLGSDTTAVQSGNNHHDPVAAARRVVSDDLRQYGDDGNDPSTVRSHGVGPKPCLTSPKALPGTFAEHNNQLVVPPAWGAFVSLVRSFKPGAGVSGMPFVNGGACPATASSGPGSAGVHVSQRTLAGRWPPAAFSQGPRCFESRRVLGEPPRR